MYGRFNDRNANAYFHELVADLSGNINRCGLDPTEFAALRDEFMGRVAELDRSRENLLRRTPVETESGARYSIEMVDNHLMPVIDVNNDTSKPAVARAFLEKLVDEENPFTTVLQEARPVYLGKEFPNEYVNSNDSYYLDPDMKAVKMQASTNLDEMLLLAENGAWRENTKAKHMRDA
ncbi:MAG: hypothetical protein J5827_01230, partial [Oscillospiraceae bacterium]|nr:hypothetical protein [Oscillospiraceae bacterium]MBO4915861.1 hypothetical protein [Oscillospiraceae bacterium]